MQAPAHRRAQGLWASISLPNVNDHGKTWKFEHRPSLISSTRYSSPEAGDRVAVACILSEAPTICFCGVWAKIGQIEKKDRSQASADVQISTLFRDR
jgi:hypothetical protein